MIASHLIGIMISKTIGFRGTLFSDTPMYVKVGGKLVPRKVLVALWKSLEMPVKPPLPSNAVGSEIVIPHFSTGWIHF